MERMDVSRDENDSKVIVRHLSEGKKTSKPKTIIVKVPWGGGGGS